MDIVVGVDGSPWAEPVLKTARKRRGYDRQRCTPSTLPTYPRVTSLKMVRRPPLIVAQLDQAPGFPSGTLRRPHYQETRTGRPPPGHGFTTNLSLSEIKAKGQVDCER